MRPNLYDTFCKGSVENRIFSWFYILILVLVMHGRFGWDWRITNSDWDILFVMLGLFCYTAPIWGIGILIYNLPKNRLIRAQRKYAISWEAMDADYRNAEEVVSNCYVSEKFSYYAEYAKAGVFPFVFKNKDIVWVYPSRMQIDKQTGYLNICTIEGKIVQVTKTMDQMEQIISFYRQRYPHMIFDDPIKVKKLYKTDMDAFLDIKYNKVMECEKIF